MAPQVGRFALDTPIFSLLKAKHFTSWRASEKPAFCTVMELRYEIFIRKVRKHQPENIRKILHHLSRLASKLRTARACIERMFQPLRRLRAPYTETLTWR